MKTRWTAFLIGFCALAIPYVNAKVPEQPQVESKGATRHLATISKQDHVTIREVISQLRGQTNVPLRWPTFIPNVTDKDHPLYVDLLSVNPESYHIEVGWIEGCDGRNVCHFGAVRGSAAPLIENEGRKVLVTLEGGIKGYFIDFTCGAHCDDAAVGWSEHGYYYSINLKAGKKETLIRMANSAILAARKPNG